LVHHTVQYKEKGNILKKQKNRTTQLDFLFFTISSQGFATLGVLVPKIKVLFRALASKIWNMRDNYK